MDIDLSEVLAQSRATTARLEATVNKSGPDSIPRLERALPQIDRESRQLAPSRGFEGLADSDAAIRLLSQHGVDTDRIQRSLTNPNLIAETDTVLDIPETDLDAHLAADHEARVVSAIAAALQHTQTLSLNSVSAALDAEWDSAKRHLIALPTIHPRQPRTAVQGTPSTAPGGVLASPYRNPPMKYGLEGDAKRQSNQPIPSKTPLRARAGATRSSWMHATSIYDAIVRRAVHARAKPSSPVDIATELDNALVAAFAPRGDILLASKQVQHLHAVLTALRYMTRESESGSGLPPRENAFGGLRAPADRRAVTVGALRYLCLQFREDKMRREVEARPRDAQRGGVPGLVGDVRAYLNLAFDRGIPAQLLAGPCIAGLPLWPQVYYCLRAGDARVALEIVEQTLMECSTTSSSVVLFRDCLAAYLESGDSRVLPDQLLAQLVHDYGMTVSRGLDNYQRVCYVVLSRLDPSAGDKMALQDDDYALLFFSIEDYLWLRLSIARLECDPAPPGALAVYSLSLAAIQDEIQEFGPSHFDERGDSPVFYSLILLLCGQFAAAIEYLEVGARAITEAVHVAFILYHYGILEDKRKVNSRTVTSDQDQEKRDRCLIVDYGELLWRYISQFASEDPATAAVYLFTIRDSEVRNKYLEQLILESRQFQVLLGDSPATVPGRSRGVLEELWPLGNQGPAFVDGEDWIALVSSAASAADRKGDRSTAAVLHDITGATVKVVEILMDRLSAELMSRESPARAHALAEAQGYLERLASRHEMVQSDLSFRTLWAVVHLVEFFDLLWSSEFERAWALLCGIGILPESNEAIPAKVRESSVVGGAWKAAVCDRIPDVVVAGMECLAGLQARGRQQPTRDTAQVLVNFAGLLPTATADMSARLIRLMVLMS
jgi:Nup93/Nic96